MMLNLLTVKKSLYWSATNSVLLSTLNSSENGLSEQEASYRLKQYGTNELVKKRKQSVVIKFLTKFTNPLVVILIAAGLISAFLGEITDFLVISTIVLVSGVIDCYQEYQAEEAAAKLNQQVAITATVLREGTRQEIPVSKVVPGDLILLSAGDIVPADSRILDSRELLVNQSTLTGESFPQEKNADVLDKQAPTVTERTNNVFMGTDVISGEAKVVVFQTGSNTEFGKLAQSLSQNRPPTEFEVGAKNFGYLLMKITLILTVVVFIVNGVFKHQILESLIFAVALAVGLTPELLPLILTINLSKGAVKMSKKGVIVKDLPAIQNFGSMNILCTDKTGTLTEDKIKLERYENLEGKDDQEVLLYGFLNSHFQTGIKNPLEKAVLEHREVSIEGFEKVDEIPFDFKRKSLSVIVKHKGKYLLITKGAPENLIKLCKKLQINNSVHNLSNNQKKRIEDRFKKLSSDGFRVLALTSKEVNFQKSYTLSDESELTFLGLMAFLDPPKESAKEALQLLQKYGVEVKILTGDNELVTKKVCEELGLPISSITTGEKLDSLNDQQLFKMVQNTTVFARLNPEQKNRIIIALKNEKDVVGFLGDGINDSISLRTADVGISVQNGVDVAKEAADLILLHKDLHILKDSIIEGRKTYGNTMKYIMMAASSNFGNIFSVAAASLFLPFLPMLPVQILLNNLLYDASQLSVPTDNINAEFLEKPRKWNINFIRHFMIIFGPISSLFDFLTFFILLIIFRATVPLFQTGWFIESLITQTLIVFSIRTKVVPFWKSKPSIFLIINLLIITILGLILPYTPLAAIFSFIIPPLRFYLILMGIIIIYFVVVEGAKRLFYSRYEL